MKKRLTVDPLAITKIVKGYYEQFYANKIKILNEMDELLGKKKHVKRIQEDIESLNISIAVESFKSFPYPLLHPHPQTPGLVDVTQEFHQQFREEIIAILQNSSK